MKRLFAFWKKDIINKLIIIVIVLLLAGVSVITYIIFNPIEGRFIQDRFSQYFTTATPTLDIDAVFTNLAQTKIVEQTPAYLRGAATITPAGSRPTGSPTPTSTPMPTNGTPGPDLTVSATPDAMDISGVKCIPNGTGQVARVLDILDGVTVKVLLDGLVYNVRYIGLELPDEYAYAGLASMVNGQLVWGRDVTLYADQAGKDDLGQLLRYVVIEEKMVNLELIQKGLAKALDLPPGFSCSQVFLEAEQAARTANIGLWQK